MIEARENITLIRNRAKMTQVSNQSHNYFSQIPNIIYHLELTAYEISLYGVLLRTAGEKGSCYKGCRTLAQEAGMSRSMTTKAKISLSKKRDALGQKSLITITKRKSGKGDDDSDLITITDIWPENMSYFNKNEGCPPERQGCPPERHRCPQDGRKNNPIKKNLNKKEEKDTGGKPPAPPVCVKESTLEKKKPTQKKERAEHVDTTDKEHQRLVDELGEEMTQACYESLSNWRKDATPRDRKKDSNRSIRDWVINKVREKRLKTKRLDAMEGKTEFDDLKNEGWQL